MSDGPSDKAQPTSSAEQRVLRDAPAGVRAELLFVLLPLLVLVIAYAAKGPDFLSRLVRAADWSFAGSVLFGQSIVKFVSGVAASPRKRPWARVAWVVSLVMVVFLAPSLVVLALMLVLDQPPTWLIVLQFVLFLCGVASHLLLGVAGQTMLDEGDADGAKPAAT